MSLKDTLRKAAGLLVEIPEEPEMGTVDDPPQKAGASPPPEVDLDKRLAELNKAIQQLDAKPAVAAPAPPATPAPAMASASAEPPKATKTVDQIVREAEGPNLDQIKVPAATPPPILTPDGKIDFSAIYQRAKLPPAPFSAEQMLEILASLPQELPLEMKRQTVKVTLSAMGKSIGANPETIVADASRKLAALSAYVDFFTKKSAELVSKSEAEIAALQAQIEEKRRAIEAAQQKQSQVLQMCSAESDRLDDVLEFFSLDVPPSKYASNT